MRIAHLAGLLLALTLLVSSTPILAQTSNPTVTDFGNNVYLVDGNQGPIPNLLPATDVQKIAILQSAPFGPVLAFQSPVSPDDQAVLARAGSSFAFLNINDGSIVPVQLNIPMLPVSNYVWTNATTLVVFSLIRVDEGIQLALVSYDRLTGSVQIGDASTLPGVPVLISENLRKVVFASLPETPLGSAGLIMQLPGMDTQIHPVDQSRQALYRELFAAQLAANPRAQAIADFARLFDPLAPGAGLLIGAGVSLYVADLATGEVRDVLTLSPGTLISDVSFSRDGNKFNIITQSLSGDPQRPIYDGALLSEVLYRDVTGNLPPAQNPMFQGNALTMLDFPSGNVQTMSAANGDGVVYAASDWSANNQTLMVQVKQPGRVAGRSYPQYWLQFLAGSSLRFYNTAMQEIRRLERIEVSDVNLRANFVSADEVLIQSHYRLDQHPYYYNLVSGEFRRIADRPGTFGSVTTTNRTRQIVFAYSSYTDPIDLYRMNWDGTAFARLTWFTEEYRQFSQTRQYPVSFTLSNGSTHTGVLILPADVPFPPQNVPIVVWQEGGPTTQVQNGWFALTESPHALLPNFGFGVLVVPLYGRFGVGADNFQALANGGNYGQIDIDAQVEIVNQMRARGWASKVGIAGCSYGGYFTTQSITRHPNTYDAAHTMCSLVDLFTEWSRGFASLAPWFQGVPPQANPAEYQRDSPIYNANQVRTPLLAFHGTNDYLPITVMQNFMVQVINNRVPAKMLKFQDADHGFLRNTPPELSRAYELYGAQEQIIWFRTYLMN